MKRPSRSHSHLFMLVAGLVGTLSAGLSVAGAVTLDTTITTVSVNGGSDVTNQGTTCVRISNPTSASCIGGFVAIPNNNKLLVSTALLSKSTASKVWLYYEDNGSSQHCPGQVFTPCSVISIEVK